jgi:hypothetical protein
MGVIAFCVGVGFILSAFLSIFLSRRLSAWQTPIADRFADDTGQVR